jgi:serine/threonine-protein kinase
MSPEQAAGRWDDVGPASDVYSLGATLFALLTGRSAFEGFPTRQEVIEQVKSGRFPRPKEVNPAVSPALEAVCMKAMALRPERRYDSTKALAEEIERWLAGEPVSAWNEPFTERARRWLARLRTLVIGLRAASALALLLIAAFAVVLAWSNRELTGKNEQLGEANRQIEVARGRAENRMGLALKAIETFRAAVSENLDVQNRPDLIPLLKTLLQAPLEFFRQLKNDLLTSREARPEVSQQLAQAILSVAEIIAQIDSQPQAMRAYEEVIEILGNLQQQYPESPIYRASLARALIAIGRLQRNSGRDVAARANFAQAVEYFEVLSREQPNSLETLADLVRAYDALSTLLRDAGQVDNALTYIKQALQVQRSLAEKKPG